MYDTRWTYTDQNGSFKWEQPPSIHELYFPLCNPKGLMSAVTPTLHGDIKRSQHEFLTLPVSVEDLHNSKAARNFWVYDHELGPWSATGNSAKAHMDQFDPDTPVKRTVTAGLLWHEMTYTDKTFGLEATILNFVPLEDQVELMVVTLKNISDSEKIVTPTSAIPIFGRGAENLRDHRHVTALVNRPHIHPNGITMQPVIHFDETGHRYNQTRYFVLGAEGDGSKPDSVIPLTKDFIGPLGDLEWPEAVVSHLTLSHKESQDLAGQECIGALRFKPVTLLPDGTATYILMLGIHEADEDLEACVHRYQTKEQVNAALKANQEFWFQQATKAAFTSGLDGFDHWMKWITLQPTLRQIYGCSFLPYHDYGKGGRGWRDLWQDCLALILLQPEATKALLLNNFGGIRADGSNATIIGSRPGEFIADRNNIPRVWMDHGAWPYLTTKLYLDQSGDVSLLLAKQTYFKDRLIHRGKSMDMGFKVGADPVLCDAQGNPVKGTILEHLLVQHLSIFFNVGDHHMLLLEGADWNDTLDMAREKGESVAFSALYASNLLDLAQTLTRLRGHIDGDTLALMAELIPLIDVDQESCDYDDLTYKQEKAQGYFKSVATCVSGDYIHVPLDTLIHDLTVKGTWLMNKIRTQEFIQVDDTHGFYNGYYNNDGQAVDGIFPEGTRMDLTGQVFTTMFGLANQEQASHMYQAAKTYLKDPKTGGYRLNTPLGPNQLNFGRGFAFAYGHKENGATFSHMVVMYVNALYQRGLTNAAYEVFKSLHTLCNDPKNSSIYPGVPEYFDGNGKGMYHYLTGSASWLFLTVLTQMYGIRGDLGDLILEPKLVKEQYDANGQASVSTTFAGHPVVVTYQIDLTSESNFNQVTSATAVKNNQALDFTIENGNIRIQRHVLELLPKDGRIEISLILE